MPFFVKDKVNNITREMRGSSKNIYLLGAGALLLASLCFLSIYTPMRFDSQRATREAVVKHRLVSIRTAEERYKARHGSYTGSFDTLVTAGMLADSMRYIPYTQGKPFALEATTMVGKSGQAIPLMECSAAYDDYLQGLDAPSIAALVEKANAEGRFAGLKIGDIAEPNDNAGNWE